MNCEKNNSQAENLKNEPKIEESWDDYMHAKKIKLQDQFSNEANKNGVKCDIFKGTSIFINGYTNPSAAEVKQLMMEYGGVYHHYYLNGKTNYMIATNLPEAKKKQLRDSSIKIIKPEWIMDSIQAGVMQNYKQYLLLSDAKEGLSRFLGNSEKTISNEDKKNDGKIKTMARNANDESFLNEFYNNSRLHHLSTMGMKFKSLVNELRTKGVSYFPGRERLKQWKLDQRQEENCEWSQETCIMHIDMDCFFVSVGMRNRSDLNNVPVAVAHARANRNVSEMDRNVPENSSIKDDSQIENTNAVKFDSMSEVASCNYEARKFGIKNGMYLGQALKLCPQLKTIPYDFRAYEEVSYAFYNHITSFTLDIEAVSCDEMYVDCTDILRYANVDASSFATFLRKEIKELVGCPCSTGFGTNRLLARLATKFAKPDGQFHIKSDDISSIIRNISVSELPGIGRSTTQKLNNMGIKICQDLQNVPLTTLQREFGNKLGLTLRNRSFGEDDRPLNFGHQRKSLSADVNYGIRFSDQNEAENFLKKLSNEVESRLNEEKMKGKSVTLKFMIKAENAPESAKFMGHGICDCITKTITLNEPTSDSNVIFRVALKVVKDMKICPKSLRGIGIQISRLEKNHNSKAFASIDKFLMKKNEISEKNKRLEQDQFDMVKPHPVIVKPIDGSLNLSKPTNEENEIKSVLNLEKISRMKCSSSIELEKVPCGFYIINDDFKPEINPSIPVLEMASAIEAWTSTEQIPLLSDVEILFTYAKCLILKKDFESLNVIVEHFQKCIDNNGQQEWNIVYQTFANFISKSY